MCHRGAVRLAVLGERLPVGARRRWCWQGQGAEIADMVKALKVSGAASTPLGKGTADFRPIVGGAALGDRRLFTFYPRQLVEVSVCDRCDGGRGKFRRNEGHGINAGLG